MILVAALLAGASAPAAGAATLPERVADVATRFCMDMVSRAVPIPAVGADEERVFARYGLVPGVPDAAMKALGRPGTSLLSRATLASGTASDGAFVVALGGAAGETCRIIVYGAVSADPSHTASAAMQVTARGWRALPEPPQPTPAVTRITLLKRVTSGRPFIANLITPRTPGPVAMIVNVAAVPPTVTIPQGY